MTIARPRIAFAPEPIAGMRRLLRLDRRRFPGFLCFFFIACLFLFLPDSAPAVNLPSINDMPETIQVQGREIALKNLKNPLSSDPDKLAAHLREGGEVYIKNCFLCHGDLLNGKGLFGDRFFPPPADFTHKVSVITLPQSYTYWRIMKGGPGLPDKFSPWDSSMPSWEDQLSEEEVWKVILYIYATAGERKDSLDGEAATEPTLERGREVYAQKCSLCHGESGKGDGPSKDYSSPRPRNFTKSHIKIRTTPFGKIPTDQDIFDRITLGMPGTTMPGWKHLPVSDRWSLVQFLKTMGKKFKKFKDRGKTHQPIVVPDPPPFSLESLASGQELYLQNCSGCHGVKGRSDGASTHRVVDLSSDAIWPRNLSKSWTFRRGHSRNKLFLTLRTGLSTTAMPRFSQRIFNDQQIWDIVHYVQTLSPAQKPAVKPTVKVMNVEGDLPSDPDDPAWNSVESYFFPLAGQIIQPPKNYFPTVDSLVMKAIHNGSEIAIHLHWDDPTFDPGLTGLTQVEESPAPPLPEHLRVEEPEENPSEEAQEPQEFPDAIAVQFPVHANGKSQKPYFLNGDSRHPVNLWKWESTLNQAQETNATGLERWTSQPEDSQGIVVKSKYRYGRYSLVLKRKLRTPDKAKDIQFQEGVNIPIAFNVWDGSQEENGNKKAISSWFEMILK